MDRKVRSSIFENTGRTDLKDLSGDACIVNRPYHRIFPRSGDVILSWEVKGASLALEFNSARFFRPDGQKARRLLDINFIPLGGRGEPNKVFFGEVPPRGPTPYHFIYHFWQERHLFRNVYRRVVSSILTQSSEFFLSFLVSKFSFFQILVTNGTPFTYIVYNNSSILTFLLTAVLKRTVFFITWIHSKSMKFSSLLHSQ